MIQDGILMLKCVDKIWLVWLSRQVRLFNYHYKEYFLFQERLARYLQGQNHMSTFILYPVNALLPPSEMNVTQHYKKQNWRDSKLSKRRTKKCQCKDFKVTHQPELRKQRWTVPTKRSCQREDCCWSWPSVCQLSSRRGKFDDEIVSYFLTLNSFDSLNLSWSFVLFPRQGLPSRAIFSSSVKSSGFLASRME